jgi:hypothetical protein
MDGKAFLKRKSGLALVLGISLLKILPLLLVVLFTRASIADLPLTEIGYCVTVSALSYIFVHLAKKKSTARLLPAFLSDYFRDFNAWKGLTVILLGPALLVWRQFFSNFRESLELFSPLYYVMRVHVTIGAILILFFAFPRIQRLFIVTKPRDKSPAWTKDIIAHLTRLRFYFDGNGPGLMGRSLAGIVGGAYLTFFYLSLLSGIWPAVLTVTTTGTIETAEVISYSRSSRYNHQPPGHYTLLTMATPEGTIHFAVSGRLSCAKGHTVTVRHNPINYFSLRSNTIENSESSGC